MRPTALVRPVPDSFVRSVTSSPLDRPLDVGLARRQHAGYVAALEAGGFEVVEVEQAPDQPDSPFIEDTAVVIGARALATRPGHPSRRGEVPGVAAVLAERMETTQMAAPATLDGGDVLVVGETVFVARGNRTNADGVDVLRAFCAPRTVVPVSVNGVLHLKSAVTAIAGDTVLAHGGTASLREFSGLNVVEVAGDDPGAANVVRLPDGRLLVSESHQATRRTLESSGHEVVTVDGSEFARADGGLTCLSIRISNLYAVSSPP